MKTWWDGLDERLALAGIPPTFANWLRQDFREHAVRFREGLAILPGDQQSSAWEVFERIFLTE